MPDDSMRLADMRAEYTNDTLEGDVPASPMTLFTQWLDEAKKASLPYNECALATASKESMPSVRIVLLKRFDDTGLCWFSDSGSIKGQALADNPHAELLFYWQQLERQIRLQGEVEQLEYTETQDYFASRPRMSQLSALVSQQSAPIANREVLCAQHKQAEAQYKNTNIPLPSRWRGYRLVPTRIEFWQGREYRLHDRIVYRRIAAHKRWETQRLQP